MLAFFDGLRISNKLTAADTTISSEAPLPVNADALCFPALFNSSLKNKYYIAFSGKYISIFPYQYVFLSHSPIFNAT